jgi:hypothetical protein
VRIAISIAAVVALALVTGCGTTAGDLYRPDSTYRAIAKQRVAVIPPQGLLYTAYHAPLDFEPASFGSKKGRATSYQIGLPPLPWAGLRRGLDLLAWGNASQRRAAVNGGITEVTHADYELRSYLYIFRIFTTEVYGN